MLCGLQIMPTRYDRVNETARPVHPLDTALQKPLHGGAWSGDCSTGFRP